MWPFRRKWQPSLAKEQARRRLMAAANDVRLQGTMAVIVREVPR